MARRTAGWILAGCLVLTGACAAPAPSPSPSVPPMLPAGLAPDHVLVRIDEHWGPTPFPDSHAPRVATLWADGRLVVSDPARGVKLPMVGTTLDRAALETAWAAVVGGGLATDRSLELPGLFDAGTTTVEVDDGQVATTLSIYAFGVTSFDGLATFPPDEAALRSNARAALVTLRELAGNTPVAPPALLLWIADPDPDEVPSTTNVLAWTAPVDLATAGTVVRTGPMTSRCVRLDGEAAAEVAGLLALAAVDAAAEQDGVAYPIDVRPISPDELGSVDCPAPGS